MRKYLLHIVFSFILILATGCGSSDDSPVADGGSTTDATSSNVDATVSADAAGGAGSLIVGNWERTITMSEGQVLITVTYHENMSLSITMTGTTSEGMTNSETIMGTWSLAEMTLTLTDEDCEDGSGDYNIVSIDSTMMELALISDACEGRAMGVPGIWRR